MRLHRDLVNEPVHGEELMAVCVPYIILGSRNDNVYPSKGEFEQWNELNSRAVTQLHDNATSILFRRDLDGLAMFLQPLLLITAKI
jgi:hypothetical protein